MSGLRGKPFCEARASHGPRSHRRDIPIADIEQHATGDEFLAADYVRNRRDWVERLDLALLCDLYVVIDLYAEVANQLSIFSYPVFCGQVTGGVPLSVEPSAFHRRGGC